MSNLITKAYPTLYKLTANKKLYIWKIYVTHEQSTDTVKLFTEHGAIDGVQVPHMREIKEGKRKLTKFEQGCAEAQSKWQTKKDKECCLEYEDAQYLINITKNAENAVNTKSKTIAKTIAKSCKSASTKSIKINTKAIKVIDENENDENDENDSDAENDSSKVPTINIKAFNFATIRPMLAKTFDPKSAKKTAKKSRTEIIYPAKCQRKLDGIRCMAYLHKNDNDNGDNSIILMSRNGNEMYNFEHIREELLDNILFTTHPNICLDGELYTQDLPFEIISGMSRLKKIEIECDTGGKTAKNVKNAKNAKNAKYAEDFPKIHYHIYDCIDINNLYIPFKERIALLRKIFEPKMSQTSSIHIVVTEDLENIENVKPMHDKYVAEGYEGIMIRNNDSPYELQKRSAHLQKYKEFMEEEFAISGYHEGDGDDIDTIIWDCTTKDGKTFAVRPKGTREYRKELLENADKYIGKQLTVIFQEWTKDNIPRFPVGKAIRME
jgi:ATP-dependent DNA ligase